MYSVRSKSKISFIIVLISVVLAFCVLVGTVSAWLTKEYNPRSEDNEIGEVKVELYHNNVKIEGTYTEVEGVSHWECKTPYEIPAGSDIRDNINLTMRNNGTIDALVRATISIYYLDANDNKVLLLVVTDTPTGNNTCKLDTTSWVYDMASDNGVAGGYMYYNDQLSPYTYREIESDTPGGEITEVTVPANEKSILNALRVSPTLSDKTLFVDVTLDAIAYTGNIYYKMEFHNLQLDESKYSALPFGLKENLPSDWIAWKERYDD